MFQHEENAEVGGLFGLMAQDLTLIKPNYDAVGKQGSGLRFTQDGYTQGKGLFRVEVSLAICLPTTPFYVLIFTF